MLVLALDTSTRVGSCAVLRDGAVLREEAGDPGRAQATKLPAALMMVLAHAEVTLPEIDVFAVAIGPGSFTGLRVGIAAMQGLAFASGKPLVGISALDALALVGDAPRVATWVDAWRGEVYTANYVAGRSVAGPTVGTPQTALSQLETAPTLFIGDGAGTYAELIEAVGVHARVAEPPAPLIAGAIGRLATELADTGHRPPPHAIRPLYVRRPDAELARDRARTGFNAR